MVTRKKKTLKEWWSERTPSQKYIIIGLVLLLTVIGSLMDNKNKQSNSTKSYENSSWKSSNSNSPQTTTHRCGRQWDEKKYAGGTYGNYCCLECYADFYPN